MQVKNADKQHFLIVPQCFQPDVFQQCVQPIQRQKSSFGLHSFHCHEMLSIWSSSKSCRLVELTYNISVFKGALNWIAKPGKLVFRVPRLGYGCCTIQ